MAPGIDHSENSDAKPVAESNECDIPHPDDTISVTYHERTNTYHVDAPRDVPIRVAITEAIQHVDAVEFHDHEPLERVVATDELDGLFASLDGTPGAQATVSFPYASCWITVDSTGSITITGTDSRTPRTDTRT
ncbi:MAG: HalOD1 output domain-containing protein [archaeon]